MQLFLFITCLWSVVPFVFLSSGEAKLLISAVIPKIVSVKTKQIIPNIDIIPLRKSKAPHTFPHVFSIFLTYNGSSGIRLIIVPDKGDNIRGHFHFELDSDSKHFIPASLYHSDTKEQIMPSQSIFEYHHDMPDPIVSREFKIGITIPASELISAQTGCYSCCLKALVIEGE